MNDPLSLPPLVAGLLVGGASRRFGRPKALASLEGRALAERVAAALATIAREIVLLGGGEVPEALARAPRVADAPGVEGPLAGVLGALASRPGSAWLIAACDQPWLDAAALEWLVACRAPGRIAVLARLAPARVEPFPGVYEPAARTVLEAIAGAGERSLQPLGRRSDVASPPVPAGLGGAWRDIDVPGDFAAPGGG